METCQCIDCGKHLSENSIHRHKIKSCKGKDRTSTADSSNLSIKGPIVNNNAKETRHTSNLSTIADKLIMSYEC